MLILKLSLPFLDLDTVLNMWRARIIDDGDVSFFICERFNLTPGVHFKLENHSIKTDNAATWDRVANQATLLRSILNNRFLKTNPRLKSQIYLGVKRSDNRLLHHYYNHYESIKKGCVKKFSITQDAVNKLSTMTPRDVGDTHIGGDSGGDIIFTNVNTNITVCVVNMNGVVHLLDHKNNKGIEFVLMSPDFISTVYNQSHKRKSAAVINHEHRRPKIRRRFVTR
jgi:hypothetical protein